MNRALAWVAIQLLAAPSVLGCAGPMNSVRHIELTPAHVSLLRRLVIAWMPVEAEAPTVDPTIPLGSNDLFRDLAEIQRAAEGESSRARQYSKEELWSFYQETLCCLKVFLENAELVPGAYEYSDVLRRWSTSAPDGFYLVDVREGGERAEKADATGVTSKFTFKKEHRTLIKHLRFGWDMLSYDPPSMKDISVTEEGVYMYPVPLVNPKRPYGDMTYMEIDMSAILGEDPANAPTQDDPGFSKEQSARLNALHEEMQQALQVFLIHAKLEPGRYPSSIDADCLR